MTVSRFIAATSEIAKEAKTLLKMLGIPARELRGVGLAVRSTLALRPTILKVQVTCQVSGNHAQLLLSHEKTTLLPYKTVSVGTKLRCAT